MQYVISFLEGDYHLYLPLPTSHAANLYFLFCRRRRKINQKNAQKRVWIYHRLYHNFCPSRRARRNRRKPFARISNRRESGFRTGCHPFRLEFSRRIPSESVQRQPLLCPHRKYGFLFRIAFRHHFFHRLDALCRRFSGFGADASIPTGSCDGGYADASDLFVGAWDSFSAQRRPDRFSEKHAELDQAELSHHQYHQRTSARVGRNSDGNRNHGAAARAAQLRRYYEK